MKNALIFALLLLFGTAVKSQYYYNDLLTNTQTNKRFAQLLELGVKKVLITSYDGNSPETAGFTAEQQVDRNKRTLRTTTNTNSSGNTFLEARYNEKGWLISTQDSVPNASNLSTYEYDASGNLVKLSTASRSDNITTTETHTWSYTANGQPQQMVRIRNQQDTTLVSFVFDEKGNLIEEVAVRKNLPAVRVYYYYDGKNRLTDIVRYNMKAKRLLPNYIFEYNENNLVTQMTMVPEGSNAYERWFYQYLPNGLRRMELVYNKDQQLMGKVEYQYEQ